MALTEFQRRICRLIASNRIERGESYVAGAGALNELIGGHRVSRDIDVFHDTTEAVAASWAGDRRLLESNGFEVVPLREAPAFVEAEVHRRTNTVLIQWARDSAYRFFPLVEHPVLGLTLHPFDLATNKVLALIGRLEARDWVDVIESSKHIQPLGYLAWAAPGKDPGFGPAAILEQAGRTARYSQEEIEGLAFDGPAPTAAELSRRWHGLLDEAKAIVAVLPPEQAGKCVLLRDGDLCRKNSTELPAALDGDALLFHHGAIRGALPRLTG